MIRVSFKCDTMLRCVLSELTKMLRAILFLALSNQLIAWISALMTDLDLDCKPLISKDWLVKVVIANTIDRYVNFFGNQRIL